ncbi:MAG: FkbM family methyltransferase [Leptolyngbyaceae cyanobacterium]
MLNFSEHSLILKYPFRESDQYVIVDVGAHHGDVSLPFARKGWKVVAFEPENKNRAVFLENLAKFSTSQVVCIPKAVADISRSTVPFYTSDVHFGIHSLKPFHFTHEFSYEVEAVNLKGTLPNLEIENVTFLKIDIEGADFLALKGFDFNRYHPELIMIEFMDQRSVSNFGYNHHDMVSYMKKFGYIAFVSEWAPITEYGREGVATPPHVWLQCKAYPLAHEPAWGNLIFVPEADEERFIRTLSKYLRYLRKTQSFTWLKKQIKKFLRLNRLHVKMIRS